MRRILATFCLCVWMLVGCTSPAKLDGRWRPVSALLGGKRYPIEAFDGATLNVDANHYEFAGDRGRCAVVPGGPPARLDIDGVEGPNAGKHIPAIVKGGKFYKNKIG